MKNTILTLSAIFVMLLCNAFSCNKEDNSPSVVSLPVSVDFTQADPNQNTSFTLNGIQFQSGGGKWRENGNCSVNSPAQPLAIYLNNVGIGLTDQFTRACSIVGNLGGATVHKVTVKMNAALAYDPITLQPLPSAYITLCDGGNTLAEIREPKSTVKDSNGQVLYQLWELEAPSGVKAQKLIISSDNATLYSVTIE